MVAAPGRLWHSRLVLRSVLAVVVVSALVGCGGSASETPPPQSVAEMTSDPVLRRPRAATSATPFVPGRRDPPRGGRLSPFDFGGRGRDARYVKPGQIFLATLVGVTVVGGPVFAAPPKKPAAPSFDVQAAALELTSGDVDRALAALERIRAAGKTASGVAPVIDRLLARGATAAIARAALVAAGEVGQPASAPIVRPYVRHRDAELRRAAVSALLKLKGKDAVAGLREALADADPRVRGTAASGLGGLGAHDALADLNAALDRKVYEAAASIAQLCAGAECDAFEGHIGKIPLDVMTSGFDAILFRTDVSDDHKVKLVLRIRDLGTAEANKYLRDVLSRWTGAARVKTSLDESIASTRSAPGATP